MGPYYARHGLTLALFAVTVVSWLAFELRQTLRRREGARRRDQGSGLVLRACVGAGEAVAAISSPWSRFRIGPQPLGFAVGLLLVWSGFAFRAWAVHSLGQFFTVTVQTSADQPVISDGPYRWLRHPSYTGAELVFLGVGVLLGSWLGVLALVTVPMIGFAYRIRVEERALDAALGSAYRSFAADRKRMIPYVW